jgi:hypothetical protein
VALRFALAGVVSLRIVMNRVTLAGLSVLALSTGCGPPSVAVESTAERCSNIVGGTPDDAHAGVLALLDSAGGLVCSGSLIRAGDMPAVLTAAHCLRESIAEAASGQDYTAAGNAHFRVRGQFPHPDFDAESGDFDFGLVLLEPGVDPAWVLPMPALESDLLSPGTSVHFVGYGSTDGPITNTLRNQVSGAILSLTDTSFEYLQDRGGPCDGDSGGPAFADVEGRTTLVGVTSFGVGDCWNRGVSARVSAAEAFIGAALGSAELPCAERDFDR